MPLKHNRKLCGAAGRIKRRCVAQPFEGGFAHFPIVPGVNWPEIMADPTAPLMFTNNIEKAFALTERGIAAIAMSGVSEARLIAWLESRGGCVTVRKGLLH